MGQKLVTGLLISLLIGLVVGFFWGLWTLIHPQLWLLRACHHWVGTWGPAIIIAGVLNKIAYIVFAFACQSAKPVKALRPEAAQIKKRYASDQAARSRELVKLYQRHGITQWMTLRPILFIPVTIWVNVGIYVALWRLPELHGVAFAWIPDLSAPDPYFGVPLIRAGVIALWKLTKRKPLNQPDPREGFIRGGLTLASIVMVVITCYLPAYLVLAFATSTAVLLGHRFLCRLRK